MDGVGPRQAIPFTVFTGGCGRHAQGKLYKASGNCVRYRPTAATASQGSRTRPPPRICSAIGLKALAATPTRLPQVGWPIKACKYFLDLLKNAEANAEMKGLDIDNLYISHCQVSHRAKGTQSEGKEAESEREEKERERRQRQREAALTVATSAQSQATLCRHIWAAMAPVPSDHHAPTPPTHAFQVNRAPKQRRRTYRAHGRINPYMSSPAHIELIVTERTEPVPKATAETGATKMSRKQLAMKRLKSGGGQ